MGLVTVSYGQMSYQSITEERAVYLVDVVGKILSAEMVTFIIFANGKSVSLRTSRSTVTFN